MVLPNMDYLNPQNITFVIGLLGILFTVYNKFTVPQINSDKTDALLMQQLSDLQTDVINLRDNHIHSLDVKLDLTTESINKINVEVARLSVIIEERIPKKKK